MRWLPNTTFWTLMHLLDNDVKVFAAIFAIIFVSALAAHLVVTCLLERVALVYPKAEWSIPPAY